MPLPNAKPDPAGSNVYRQLNSIKLGDLTNNQFDVVYDNVFLNDMSEDELRRLALIGAARQSFSASSSGPIPIAQGWLEFTQTGSTSADGFSIKANADEVWQIVAISAKNDSTPSTQNNYSFYWSKDDPFVLADALLSNSTGSSSTIVGWEVFDEGIAQPLYVTGDVYFHMYSNLAGNTSVIWRAYYVRVR